jgi:hypothetical protein
MIGVAYWKGKITPRVSDALVSSLDFLPTFAALADIQLPSDRSYDGIDISDVLFAGDDTKGHTTLFHPNGAPKAGWEPEGAWDARARSITAMRIGRYKAHFFTHGSGKGGCQLANGTHHSPAGKQQDHFPTGGGVPLIFDLTVDPSESQPLTRTHPRSLGQKFNATVAAFVSAYEAFWHDVNATMRSITNYSSGGDDFRPCSNSSSACCRLYPSYPLDALP